MGFVPEKLDSRQRLAEKLAVKFYGAVNRIKPARYGLTAASREFYLLLKKHEKKVKRCLSWYCKHMKDEFVPQAHTAKQFRLKFDVVYKAMQADPSAHDYQAEDKRVSQYLLNSWNWPPEVAKVLPLLVKKTRLNWTKFLLVSRKLRKFLDKTTNNRTFDFMLGVRYMTFLDNVVLQRQQFVDEWFADLHSRIGHFTYYNANVNKLAFHPESESFKNHLWARWSFDWCCRADTMDDLLRRLITAFNKRN